MKNKQGGSNKNKEKKKLEVVGNITLTPASEDEDLYICFLNKKMRYFTKKLKEISDLEKQEGELKAEQKEKISKKENFLKESDFFDQTKFLYSTFLKETNCPGIKLQKEEKIAITEVQQKAEEQEKQKLTEEIQILQSKIDKIDQDLNQKNVEIDQLNKKIKEKDEIQTETIRKIIEARFLDQYYTSSKVTIDHKIAEIVGPLRQCFQLRDSDLLKIQLSQSVSSLENYLNSNSTELISQLIQSQEIQNYSVMTLQKEENIQQQQQQQQQEKPQQQQWANLNDQEDSLDEEDQSQEQEEQLVQKQVQPITQQDKMPQKELELEEEDDWNEPQQEKQYQPPVKQPQQEKEQDSWHTVGPTVGKKKQDEPQYYNKRRGQYKKNYQDQEKQEGYQKGGERKPKAGYQGERKQQGYQQKEEKTGYQGQRGNRRGGYRGGYKPKQEYQPKKQYQEDQN